MDVAQFQALLAECEQPDHTSDVVCSDCLPTLTEAVRLYRDDFLAGFTLSDCPDFDDWQFFQSETLRQTLSSVLDPRGALFWIEGDFDAALPYARQWLSLDPFHEPAHRQLMQLYTQTGQKAAALRQYQTCVSMLAEELGIAPSDETIALYERIRVSAAGRESAGWLDERKMTLPCSPLRPWQIISQPQPHPLSVGCRRWPRSHAV